MGDPAPETARAGVERATKATAIRSLFMILDTPIVIGDRGDALTLVAIM